MASYHCVLYLIVLYLLCRSVTGEDILQLNMNKKDVEKQEKIYHIIAWGIPVLFVTPIGALGNFGIIGPWYVPLDAPRHHEGAHTSHSSCVGVGYEMTDRHLLLC